MANELKHGSVGTELTQAEWEGIGTHVVANQAIGDLIYASSTSQLRRLGISGTGTYILSISGGVPVWAAPAAAAAGSLTGSTLASGVTASSLTSVGTIATGVWQGTDVGVAYGGTGVSTLAANGVLIGNGASAITSVVMTTKGHILIGDGSGNPQMLGVGTNTHVMTADSGETTGVKWAAPAAAAAGSLTGSTLASGVTASSLTSLGTIATGVWQGTDVGVAYGGTGVSTLTSNAVLTGNGASAITAESNMLINSAGLIAINRSSVTSGLVIIGGSFTGADGFPAFAIKTAVAITPDAGDSGYGIQVGNTLAEAGSGTHPLMAQLALFGNAVTNAGATTTTASTLYISAAMSGADSNNYALFVDAGVSRFDGDIDLNSAGTLLNVGASGNDWTATLLALQDSALLKIGATTAHGTTAGTNLISLFNGTAPAGTLANGASFFCASGEMKVIDAAGNITTLSPHDDEGRWVFHSQDSTTGRVLHVEMEKLMRRLDEEFGGGYIEEFVEAIGV